MGTGRKLGHHCGISGTLLGRLLWNRATFDAVFLERQEVYRRNFFEGLTSFEDTKIKANDEIGAFSFGLSAFMSCSFLLAYYF